MIDLSKLRRGDLVLVHSPLRSDGSGLGSSASGLYVVLEVGAAAASVVPAASLHSSQNHKVRAADIVAHVRAFVVNEDLLPRGKPMDLASVPAAQAHPVAHDEPAPAEPQLIKLRIINPRPGGYGITRPGDQTRGVAQVTTVYKAGELAFVDGAGQAHHDIEVDSRDASQFLEVDGAYRPREEHS